MFIYTYSALEKISKNTIQLFLIKQVKTTKYFYPTIYSQRT